MHEKNSNVVMFTPKHSGRITPEVLSPPGRISLRTMDPLDLVTPRRMDLAVKVLYFKEILSRLHGGDDSNPYAFPMYEWTIEKRSGDRFRSNTPTDVNKLNLWDYHCSAHELAIDMSEVGFKSEGAIPIDPDGELLDGSHRVACAIALEFNEVYALSNAFGVWAPPWDADWFCAHKMPGHWYTQAEDLFFELIGPGPDAIG